MKRIGASLCATLAAAACLAGDLTVDGSLNVNSNLAARSLSATNASLVSVSVASNVVVAGSLVVSNAAAASGGAVVFDPGNAGTNRYGGAVSVLGLRVREGSNTVATGYGAHAEGIGTSASGYASFAGGWNASAAHDNSFVWSDGTAVGSTSTNQFTVFALGGIRLLGGPVSGNGSGLTNLNVAAAVPAGSVTSDKLAANAVASANIADSSVTSAKILDGTIADADIAAGASIALSKVAGLQTAVNTLNAHTASTANPHAVTAAQVGAYTIVQADAAVSQAVARVTFAGGVATNAAGDLSVVGALTARTLAGGGFGITNLNLAAYAGSNLVWDAVSNRLNASYGSAASGRASLGLGSAATNDAAAFAPSDLSAYASDTVTYSNGHFRAAVQLTPADVAGAVLDAWPDLDTDGSDDLTSAGGTLAGNLDMNGNRVSNLPLPQADGDAVSRDMLRRVLSGLKPQGDLSMGAYTNGAPSQFYLEF